MLAGTLNGCARPSIFTGGGTVVGSDEGGNLNNAAGNMVGLTSSREERSLKPSRSTKVDNDWDMVAHCQCAKSGSRVENRGRKIWRSVCTEAAT